MAQRLPLRSRDRELEEFSKTLKQGAEVLGLALDEERIGDFCLYFSELKRWNRKKDLTALRDPKEVAIKHFLDSMSLLRLLAPKERVLDIGSGAGFPGVVLKICERSLGITLLEASFKRVVFLKQVRRILGLEDLEIVHGRAEDREIVKALGHGFDVVISRALGPLKVFLAFSEPYLGEHARAIAMKGPRWREEVEGLGGVSFRLQQVLEFELPFSMGRRALLVFSRT